VRAWSGRYSDRRLPARVCDLKLEENTSNCSRTWGIIAVGRIGAAPWCNQTLADLWADIIKIERPGLFGDGPLT